MIKRDMNFTSALTKREAIAAIAYLPVHVLVLPLLLDVLMIKGLLGVATANLLLYVAGTAYMLLFMWKFLRREFDTLIDNLLHCFLQICICYGLMMLANMLMSGILLAILPAENPNNAAIMDMADSEYGKMAALAIFLAPIVEEIIFRAGIFGVLRRRSRVLAYTVSVLLFSAYHVWGYVAGNPEYWLFIIQYIPVSYLLCRCYEKSNCIWSSIFMHMLINGISIKALTMLEELV